MDRSTIKLEILESLAADKKIHNSAGNDLTDSAPCSSGTNPENDTELKQESFMSMNEEIPHEKMEKDLIEPSLRMISNLVVIAPQKEGFGEYELFQTNKRPYSSDHQEDISQDITIPAVKQEIIDVVIKEEITEDVPMDKIDDKNPSYEEHIKLEDGINCPWLGNLQETSKTEKQPVVINSLQKDLNLIKSDRIDGDLCDDQMSLSERVHKRRFHPGTNTVTSSDDDSDYDESCSPSSGDEFVRNKKKINGSKSLFHLHSDTQPIICPVCGLGFQGQYQLSRHISVHIGAKFFSPTGDKPIACDVCNKSFTQAATFKNHMRTHQNVEKLSGYTTCHFGDQSALDADQIVEEASSIITKERPFPCDNVLPKESSLKVHSLEHSSERSHLCTTCAQSFITLQALQDHQRTHTEEKPYGCTLCDESFMTEQALQYHQKKHSGEKLYDESFLTGYRLKRHQRTHTGETLHGNTPCNKSSRDQNAIKVLQRKDEALSLTSQSSSDCDKVSPKESSLEAHLLKHSSESTRSDQSISTLQAFQIHQRIHTGEKPYACTTCDKSFMTQLAFQIHQRTHTGEKPYGCTTSDKSFMTQQDFQQHRRTHTGEKLYACTTCGESFRDQKMLKDHQRTHTEKKPYKCTICDKSFLTLQILQCHQQGTHTLEKPYGCATCDKVFKTQRGLLKHEKIHPREKPINACSACGKYFMSQYHLEVHQRTHTGEKPYGCTTCDESFSSKTGLQYHQRTHTGEKPYKCTTCDKRFRDQHTLNVHQRTHTPYRCTTCHQSFRALGNFKVHQRTHTGEKPYGCTTCDKSFMAQHHLQQHQRTHSGEKTYKCTTCDKSFKALQVLQRHQRTHTQ